MAFSMISTESPSPMTKQILEFTKTDHFMHSQWNRDIDDPFLYKVLPFVDSIKCGKDVVIVTPSFLKPKNIAKDDTQCLILIIRDRRLLTTYWCNDPNYLFRREKNAHFQLIYK